MISTELNTILFKILNKNAEFKNALGGGIYKGNFRPMDSPKDDTCVNVLALTQDNPQIGIANINIYVADLTQTFNGKSNKILDSNRLENLSKLAFKAVDLGLIDSDFKDIGFTILEDKTFQNEGNSRAEHYQNLRLQFIIPKKTN